MSIKEKLIMYIILVSVLGLVVFGSGPVLDNWYNNEYKQHHTK